MISRANMFGPGPSLLRVTGCYQGCSGETQERSCKNTQNANGYSPGIRIRVKLIEQRTLTYCI
jgi:hypothetical protein